MLGQAIDMLTARKAEVQGDRLWPPGLAIRVCFEALLPPARRVALLQSCSR